MKKLGIFTKDPRLFYRLIKELNNYKFEFFVIADPKNIPPNTGAILCSKADHVEFDRVVYCEKDLIKSIRTAIAYSLGKDTVVEMIIGIDPGPTPGIVVVGDGTVLEELALKNTDAIKDVIPKIAVDYHPLKFKIKIGSGDLINRNRIINQLVDHYPVEIVNEKNTSAPKHNDINSAKKIAFLDGTLVTHKQKINYLHGGILEIQKKSRRITNGKITISRELAMKVLIGTLDIDHAIELQKNKNDR